MSVVSIVLLRFSFGASIVPAENSGKAGRPPDSTVSFCEQQRRNSQLRGIAQRFRRVYNGGTKLEREHEREREPGGSTLIERRGPPAKRLLAGCELSFGWANLSLRQ